MIFNICQGGMFVGDQSSVRKLANIINSTNSAANKTIANSAFSMNQYYNGGCRLSSTFSDFI